MTLDLDELASGWDCPSGELRARIVVGRDGEEMVQIRLDLGVMQMLPAGRPDGARYHGLPSACEYIEHELRVGGDKIDRVDWQELQRELHQINYRRLAYSMLAEDALQANDDTNTRRHMLAALDDIDACLTQLQLLADHGHAESAAESLRPTLHFDRARMRSQLHVVEGRFEEAIEQAEAGAARLEELLTELGYDEELREEDPGVRYLCDLGHQLRREYGVTQTLRERLEEALDNDDFETAAEIRDSMRQRGDDPPPVE